MLKYSFTFQIHYKANLGETLVLVGNHPKLGNWDVKNGIKMEWSNVNFILFLKFAYLKILKRVTIGENI